jgi:Ca-activated chloride channel family protein
MNPLSNRFYDVLGVSNTATPSEVRKAYHEAARKLHPDANSSPGAVEQFISVQEAFNVLSDPGARADYDALQPDGDYCPGASISTLYSRRHLTNMPDEQLLYVLLSVVPEQENIQARPRLNLSLVIDRSTSMQGARMDRVKQTARNIVRQLASDDYVAITAFSDRGEVIVPANRISNAQKIESKISLLHPGGATEIFSGLDLGYQEVSKFKRQNTVNHLILITDGHTYGDEEECLALAEKAAEEGVTITTLGIGHEWNSDFLDSLAVTTGGDSRFVARAREIESLLQQKMDDLGQSFIKDITLELNDGSAAQLNYVFRVEPEPAKLTPASVMRLGPLSRNQRQSVILEYLVKVGSDAPRELSISSGTLVMDIPGRILSTVRAHVEFERRVGVTGEDTESVPPDPIVQAMSKLTLFRMQEKAAADIEVGDVQNATVRLRHLATHLLSQGESVLAKTVIREAGRLENGAELTEMGRKNIRYGTRALLLPPGDST